jgi:hypothetical protein
MAPRKLKLIKIFKTISKNNKLFQNNKKNFTKRSAQIYIYMQQTRILIINQLTNVISQRTL